MQEVKVLRVTLLVLCLFVALQATLLATYWRRLETQSTLVLAETDTAVSGGPTFPVTIRLTNLPELSELLVNDKHVVATRNSHDLRHATYGPINVVQGSVMTLRVFGKGGTSSKASIRINGERWIGIDIQEDWINIQASSGFIGFV